MSKQLVSLPWLSALLFAGPLLMGATAAPDNRFDLLLKPRSANGVVVGVAVKETIRGAPYPAGATLLRMPIVATLAPGALTDAATLTATDAQGPVPLNIVDDPVDPSNFKQDRRWMAGRATVGAVVVRYEATPRLITPATRPGPLIDTRTEGAGVYGAFRTLLALPESGWPRPVFLRWDLSEMPAGSRVGTSLGMGDQSARLGADKLAASFFMAGPLHSLPTNGKGAFVVFWLTPPAWDLPAAAEWTRKAYDYFGSFWGYPGLPFKVFMRTTVRFQGGGGGGYQSFIFGNVEGDRRDIVEARELMAHETSHNFVGHVTGDSTAGGQWYSEGADVYYTNVLTYRAGLTPLNRWAHNMNTLVAEYYQNPLSHLTNAEVTRQFFTSHDAEVVSYQRGPLYFAVVDARMRAMSGGKRRVDELVRAMVKASREGAGATAEGWASLLKGALGQPGVDEFEAMMAGKTLDLPPDLLGACFSREPQVYRQYRPGFRPDVGEGGVARVSRLQADSAAARAGLKEGDQLLTKGPEPIDQSLGGRPVTLQIRRNGQLLSIAFDPWGPPVQGWRYVRNASPAAACKI